MGSVGPPFGKPLQKISRVSALIFRLRAQQGIGLCALLLLCSGAMINSRARTRLGVGVVVGCVGCGRVSRQELWWLVAWCVCVWYKRELEESRQRRNTRSK